jgi:Flp pilus assembly pilin Flp
MYRGRRHLVVSAGGGLQSDAPFFRLRDVDDGWVVTGLVSYKLLELMPEEFAMNFFRAREFLISRTYGQTLVEYTLVLVAIAIAAIGSYLALGNDFSSLASGVDSALTSA